MNDYGYRDVPEHAHDSRWVHRPRMDWDAAASRHAGDTDASRIFTGVQNILARRRATPALHAAHPTQILHCDMPGIFAFRRAAPTGALVCLFNFTESWQHIPEGWLRAQGATRLHDELSDAAVQVHHGNIALPPHARVWIG